jgi:hypothetical protein
MNDCQCTGPGWCERHGVKKSALMVQLCQRNPSYWEAWEAGHGPGQCVKKKGLGDMVAGALGAVGITPARYTAAKASVGLKRKCKCKERQAALNALGRKVGIGT